MLHACAYNKILYKAMEKMQGN